jgi:putative ABC transport system ATP-binding protein
MSDHLLEFINTTRTYQHGDETVYALNDLSTTVERGEFTVIAGPSGSGKTTLLNLAAALDQPTSGTVRLNGLDLATLTAAERATLRMHSVGFVFQSYNLVPVLSARENAEFVLLLQRVPVDERRRRVEEVLKQVGLEGLEDRRPAQLSGGQQQRVAIARAIAANPNLVLADEPTANLDSETASALLDLMEELNRERNITFLFSTHDPRVMDRARRVIRLVDGRIDADEHRSEAAT